MGALLREVCGDSYEETMLKNLKKIGKMSCIFVKLETFQTTLVLFSCKQQFSWSHLLTLYLVKIFIAF